MRSRIASLLGGIALTLATDGCSGPICGPVACRTDDGGTAKLVRGQASMGVTLPTADREAAAQTVSMTQGDPVRPPTNVGYQEGACVASLSYGRADGRANGDAMVSIACTLDASIRAPTSVEVRQHTVSITARISDVAHLDVGQHDAGAGTQIVVDGCVARLAPGALTLDISSDATGGAIDGHPSVSSDFHRSLTLAGAVATWTYGAEPCPYLDGSVSATFTLDAADIHADQTCNAPC